MEFLKTTLALLLIVALANAQLVIEEVGRDSSDSRTITISTSEETEGRKSEWGAAFLSLGIPGLGQFYLEDKQAGAAFLSIDVALLAGTIFFEASSRRQYRNSIGFAQDYAECYSTRGWEDLYWKHIGQYGETILSNDQWNTTRVDKYRDFDNRYEGDREPNDGDDYWSWTSIEAKEDYVAQRARGENYHVTSFILLGGMMVNRVISFIDARMGARQYNSSLNFSDLQIYPYYASASQTGGVTIVAQF